MKQITVTVPEGYEDVTHVVLVSTPEVPGKYAEYAATVLAVEPVAESLGVFKAESVVEEVGAGTSLNDLMTDAARVVRSVVRTGTAVVKSSS